MNFFAAVLGINCITFGFGAFSVSVGSAEIVVDSVKAVANFFSADCVYILTKSCSTDVLHEKLAKILSLEFGPSFGFSNFSAYGNVLKKGDKEQCQVPLRVISQLNNGKDLKVFNEFYTYHADRVRSGAWLVFTQSFDEKPVSDLLWGIHMPLDAEVIIAWIHDDVVHLKEVYQVAPSYPIRQPYFGNWSRSKGLNVSRPSSGQFEKTNLEGLRLKVGYIEDNMPFTVMRSSGRGVVLGGYFGEIWSALENFLNMSSTFIKVDLKRGRENVNSWLTIMDMIKDKKIDAGLADFFPSNPRIDLFDFSHPLLTSDSSLQKNYVLSDPCKNLLTKITLIGAHNIGDTNYVSNYHPFECMSQAGHIHFNRNSSVFALNVVHCITFKDVKTLFCSHPQSLRLEISITFKVFYQYIPSNRHSKIHFHIFGHDIWLTLLVWAVINSVCISCTTFLRRRFLQKKERVITVQTSFFMTLTGLCAQGSSSIPRFCSCRILFLFTYVVAAIIMPTYSSSLTRQLTSRSPGVTFHNLINIHDKGFHKLIAVDGSYEYFIFKSNKGRNVLGKIYEKHMKNEKLPKSYGEALALTCRDQKVAFFTVTSSLVWELNKKKNAYLQEECRLKKMSQNVGKSVNAIIFPKNSRFRKIIDHQLKVFHSTGVIRRLQRKYWPSRIGSRKKNWESVSLWNSSLLFEIILCGGIVSVLLVILEKTVKNAILRRTRKKRRAFLCFLDPLAAHRK